MGSGQSITKPTLAGAAERHGLRSWLSPIDKITLAFCVWMLVYMLAGIILGRAESPEIYFPRYLSICTLVLLLAWLERSYGAVMKPGSLKVLQFVRGVYPVALFGFFYTSLHSVSLIVFGDWLDPWFMGIDLKLFGYYPSLVWGKAYDTLFMQELFHFAYFCYYPMIGGLPVYFYFTNKKAFGELIFNLSFVFYACYFFFSLIPVVGARFIPEAYQLAHAYRHGPFTHIMAFIYNHSGHWGGAFPSSHIAITLVLTIAALKYARKLGYLFVVISIFLSLATVFCHYHWFIDAVAGVFAGVLGYFAADWVRIKLQREKL